MYTPAKWRAWLPDLQIPDGLTFEDLNQAAAAIRAWGDGEEPTAIPLAAELFERLTAAALKNRETGLLARGGH
jgi:hypothetical protein